MSSKQSWSSFFTKTNEKDDNITISELDPKKVKLTFTDIFNDYKMFRQEYIFGGPKPN